MFNTGQITRPRGGPVDTFPLQIHIQPDNISPNPDVQSLWYHKGCNYCQSCINLVPGKGTTLLFKENVWVIIY